MSDNAETREAADRLRLLDALDDAWTACPHAVGFCRHCMHAVLAALPPVAGPEVRPDETLRALSEAATPGVWRATSDPLGHHVEDGRGRGRLVTGFGPADTDIDNRAADAAFTAAAVNHVRALLTAPTPTPGEGE